MIKFPRLHIAESVLNRISNALEENGPLGLGTATHIPAEMQEAPEVPNTAVLGTAINQKVGEPLAPVSVDPENAQLAGDGMVAASAMGGSPFDGALTGLGA